MKKTILLFLICILLCASCGKKDNEEITSAISVEQGQADHSDFDWHLGKWNNEWKNVESGVLYPKDYEIVLGNEFLGEHTSRYVVNGAKLYCLNTYVKQSEEGWEYTYYFNTYDSKSATSTSNIITVPALEGYATEDCKISSFDVLSDNEIVFFVHVKEKDKAAAFLAVHTNAANEVLKTVDLQKSLLEVGVGIDNETDSFYGDICADIQGLYYAYDIKQIAVLNSTGEISAVLGKKEENVYCSFAFKSQDGYPIFLWTQGEESTGRLVYYDKKTGEKTLSEGIPINASMALSDNGYLYYAANDAKLYRWDLVNGERCMYEDFASVGASGDIYNTQLTLDAEGWPLLLDYAGTQARVYASSTTPVERESIDIKMVNLQRNNVPLHAAGFVADSANRFVREHSNYKISVDAAPNDDMETAWEDQKKFRTKVLVDLVSGEIADIYLVDAEDYKMLYEKGILTDLSDVLTDDIKKNIFNSSQKGGLVDGKQMALIPEANVSTVFVSDDIWEKDSWTLEEAVDLMEQNTGLPYLISHRDLNAGQSLLFDIYLKNLSNTPFLNLKDSVCDFTNPIFGRLISQFKDYEYRSGWEYEDQCFEESAGIMEQITGYYSFSTIMSRYEKGYHIVGYPSADGIGNYWNPDVYLVVTNKAKNMEEIKEFLRYLFSAENQSNTYSSVRNDLLDQFVEYSDGWGVPEWAGWRYHMGNSYAPMAKKSDGSSWAEDYVAFMESCVYPEPVSEEVMQLIKEEVYDYYDGYSSVDTAVKNIQNRVQLYLEERK